MSVLSDLGRTVSTMCGAVTKVAEAAEMGAEALYIAAETGRDSTKRWQDRVAEQAIASDAQKRAERDFDLKQKQAKLRAQMARLEATAAPSLVSANPGAAPNLSALGVSGVS